MDKYHFTKPKCILLIILSIIAFLVIAGFSIYSYVVEFGAVSATSLVIYTFLCSLLFEEIKFIIWMIQEIKKLENIC